MANSNKILLLDDDMDVLETYRALLTRLPSGPEIHTASSGARALNLLDSEPFTLLLSDLRMPKMDGLQVLTIVRRKFPQLRTAVMTAVGDDQLRARAYAIGIDLYLEKPTSPPEIQFLLDCIEALLGQGQPTGFRGLQSKGLVDIIQLECLSQSSSLLRITNGTLEGKIWFLHGDVIDATTGPQTGVEAFQTILSWKTGNFEILPPEPDRPRTIHTSSQGLLLETAQALDEAQAEQPVLADREHSPMADAERMLPPLNDFTDLESLLLALREGDRHWTRGVADPTRAAAWARHMIQGYQELGQTVQVGDLQTIESYGFEAHLALAPLQDKVLCAGFRRNATRSSLRQSLKQLLTRCAS